MLCLEQEDGSGGTLFPCFTGTPVQILTLRDAGFTALMLRRVSAACKYDDFLLIRIDASDLVSVFVRLYR